MERIAKIVLFLAGIGVTVAYIWAPPAKNFPVPEAAKIMFFHVPPAMLCTAFFLWGAIMGGRYLMTKDIRFDIRSLAAIEIGTLLVILATLTGMIFAKMQWGAFWEWDPRQVLILLQLLIYLAYFALRTSIAERQRAAIVSAGYSIFAFLTVPFLIWALPRIPPFATQSRHAGANEAVVGGGLDPTYRIIFYSTLIVVFFAFALAYRLRVREAEISYAWEAADELDSRSDSAATSRVVGAVRLRDKD
ncbi:MAG TPA: cytochrome c biogenesis protein [Fimbriimonadales bacterium]|nr:cytochrome c biogenesis protein [Fimbriimonadales bacterium]